VAITIRQGVAVCAQRKHLFTVGFQPSPVSVEASANPESTCRRRSPFLLTPS
jgi:hypothetical protein